MGCIYIRAELIYCFFAIMYLAGIFTLLFPGIVGTMIGVINPFEEESKHGVKVAGAIILFGASFLAVLNFMALNDPRPC